MNGKRILAYLIDTGIIFVGGNMLILPFELFASKYVTFALGIILFGVFFCRDSFTGQSFGKHIMKIVVTHNGSIVSPIRGLLRNMTLMIWPVDVILFLFRTERLGDILCKCTVREIMQSDTIKFRMSAIVLVVIFAIVMGLLSLLIIELLPGIELLYM